MVAGVTVTPSTLNFESTGPRWSEIANFDAIIARSASAVIPSEKSSINTNRKSTTLFPMSLRWSSYVAPKSPKGTKKTAVFPLKLHFAWRKYATKFIRVMTVSGKFVGHTLHAKWLMGNFLFYLKFWVKLTALEQNRRFSIYFHS